MRGPEQQHSLMSRRQLLELSAAVAGGVMLGGCGEQNQRIMAAPTDTTPSGINGPVDPDGLVPAVHTGDRIQVYPIPPPPALFYAGETIRKINTSRKIMVLTFDDGPDKVHERGIHQVLKDRGYEGKAAWFFVGINALARPDVVKEMYDYGYEICNHTKTHGDYSVSGEAREIEPTQEILYSLTGELPLFFRGAGGTMGNAISQELARLGMAYIWTSGNERDSEAPRVSPATMNGLLSYYLSPGYISLRHSGGTHDNTLAAMHDAITIIENAGFEIMSLREALSLREDGVNSITRPNFWMRTADNLAMTLNRGAGGPVGYDLAADIALANAA